MTETTRERERLERSSFTELRPFLSTTVEATTPATAVDFRQCITVTGSRADGGVLARMRACAAEGLYFGK